MSGSPNAVASEPSIQEADLTDLHAPTVPAYTAPPTLTLRKPTTTMNERLTEAVTAYPQPPGTQQLILEINDTSPHLKRKIHAALLAIHRVHFVFRLHQRTVVVLLFQQQKEIDTEIMEIVRVVGGGRDVFRVANFEDLVQSKVLPPVLPYVSALLPTPVVHYQVLRSQSSGATLVDDGSLVAEPEMDYAHAAMRRDTAAVTATNVFTHLAESASAEKLLDAALSMLGFVNTPAGTSASKMGTAIGRALDATSRNEQTAAPAPAVGVGEASLTMQTALKREIRKISEAKARIAEAEAKARIAEAEAKSRVAEADAKARIAEADARVVEGLVRLALKFNGAS
ncbi:hypothetical protein BC832DRAFT_589901 [Gaertneriomyces semiglobifer]|nr:hypothetical protein BC832DRAFT_589901 [Gaertneriomyces semiglobifer]